MLKKILFACCILLYSLGIQAQPEPNYRSLDASDPIAFAGDHITYKGEKIVLGTHALFLDGSLPDAVADRYPYVFNNFQKAVAALSDGTEAQPMVIYMAPWVYWADDPDDPEIRKPKPGRRAPFGMEIECEWLRFYGLTDDPVNVVIASNRGQTHGADGNFTMFNFRGDGLSAENVTFGNYCNIDLEFPLNPALNRVKRASAIVQAQLAFTNADRAWAKNTRFISRLNLCPFMGGRRVFFYQCHFECTDDALCGTAVHLDCTLDFYASKPFGSTQGTGAVFLNCDMTVLSGDSVQYINKVGNQVAIVDSRFHAPTDNLYMGWTGAPYDFLRCYQYNVTLNGNPVFMEKEHPHLTVDMTGKRVLDAYRIEHEGKVIYNTYNLLRGEDDWDPMGVKEEVIAAGKAAGKDYTAVPTYLKVQPVRANIQTGTNDILLDAAELRFGNYPVSPQPLSWVVSRGEPSAVTLKPVGADGCLVTPVYEGEAASETLNVAASTASGLESAAIVNVRPPYLDPPAFTKSPKIFSPKRGMLAVEYGLELGNRLDESLITWYRSASADGSGGIEVAVSRLNRPEFTYDLQPGDIGYYITAEVRPKHLRSLPGESRIAITKEKITAADVVERNFSTDFRNFPTAYQPHIIPGTWTLDGYKPADTDYYDWVPDPDHLNWDYREGIDGSAGVLGLTQIAKGARMLYTPVEGSYGDMSIAIEAAPGKAAGQGFGSATGQYMDIFIQYDTRTMTGYGLRIIRTPKYGDAVDFILMEYRNGTPRELSEPVSTDVYRTDCSIRLEVRASTLKAVATTTAPRREPRPGVTAGVVLEAKIVPASYGGMGIQHTGSTGAGATWLKKMDIRWE